MQPNKRKFVTITVVMKLFKREQQDLPRRRQNEERTPTVEVEDSYAFKRGRTLTGSASSHVRTSNEFQADLKSSRVQIHELHRKRRRITGIFAGTLLVLSVLFMLISQFTATPTVQASPDPSLQLDTVYVAAIDSYLGDHVSERLRFFTNTERLTEYVQSVAPEVENITPRGSSGFGKSLFEITFREPIASWNVGGKELYVDGAGIPFTRNYFASPTLRITDQSGLSSALSGQSVMSNRFMSYVGQVIGLAKEQGYTVSTIVIPTGMTRQVEVHVQDLSYFFKFSSDRPAGEGVADMVKTIQWMESHQVTPEYVDVRVDGRVFYR